MLRVSCLSLILFTCSTLPCMAAPCNTTVSILPKKWTEFTPLRGDFSVNFPTKASEVELENSRLFFSNQSEISYFVFQKPVEEITVDFEGLLSESLAKESHSNLINKKQTTFQGHEALAFIFESQEKIVEGLYLSSGKTLYQVFAVYKRNGDNQEKFKRFISSFHLLH